MSILSAMIKSQVKKRGLIGLLIKVGDTVVKIWLKIKQFINEVR